MLMRRKVSGVTGGAVQARTVSYVSARICSRRACWTDDSKACEKDVKGVDMLGLLCKVLPYKSARIDRTANR
jgi:hypothetical protein